MTDAFSSSYLVQRLLPPKPVERRGEPEWGAFGGGYKNGGLSDDAYRMLQDLWQFDYMGAAEFEFGAVPKGLSAIAVARDQLVAFRFEVKTKNTGKVYGASLPGEHKGVIMVLCQRAHVPQVVACIKDWAYEEFGRTAKHLTKSPVGLERALRQPEGADLRRTPVGWLELDNGYMFFVDEDMFKGTCRLFGVEESKAPEECRMKNGSSIRRVNNPCDPVRGVSDEVLACGTD